MDRIKPNVVAAVLLLKIDTLTKMVMQFSLIEKNKHVSLSNEIAEYKNVLNGKMKYLFTFLLLVLLQTNGFGATKTWDGGGGVDTNWNTAANWNSNTLPAPGDDIVIANGFTVTVNVAVVCNTLIINGGGSANTVTISGTNSLSVTGAVTINAGTGNGDNKVLSVGAGSLSCTSITMATTGNDNRYSRVSISSGSITVSGDVIMNDTDINRNQVVFTAGGNLYIGGTMTGGALTPSTGTVDYNNAGAQNIGSYTYNNLTLSVSGTKTASNNLTVNGALTTIAGTTLNMSTYALSGTLSTITNAGTIRTQNTTGAPIPTGKTWGGTVQYNATTGGQTVMAGTYNNLTLSNTSGTQTTSGALTVNGTLTTTSGGTLDMSTNLLQGSLSTITNGGIIRTQNTSTTPIPAAKTWGGTVQYDGAGQTVVNGTYNNLNLLGSGTKAFSASTVTISNTISIGLGVVASLGTNTGHTADKLTLNGSGQNAGTWGSTASAATFKNATYFGAAGAGILTVGTSTCGAGYWYGVTSTDWNTASNWCNNTVPTAAMNVIIPAGSINMPTIGAGTTALANNLTIDASATLTVVSDATSLLNISGNFINNGTFNAGTLSTTSFVGANQSIATGTYGNLTLSGSGTKSFSATALTINNKLIINSGVLADLSTVTHNAFALTLGGIGPLFGTWGSTSSGATNTTNTYFVSTGRINVTSASVDSLIDNNYATYGTTGADGGTVGEYQGPITVTAPNGKVFINTKFASYGLPIGTFPNFTIGTCHALASRDITIGLLGNTTGTIGTGGFNTLFTDPCYGATKSYSIVATYADPICSGSNSVVIDGSTPTGGAVGSPYIYVWEQSTTSASSGYSVIAGQTGEDYTPPVNLTQTTYYKRTVTSGSYSDATIVIVPVISAPSSAPVIVSSCSGSTLTVTAPSTVGTYVEWFAASSCGVTVLATGTTFSPASAGTYSARYRNACGSSACSTGVAGTVTYPITVNPTSNPTICASTSISTANLTYTATGSPTTYSIVWNNTPTNYLLDVVNEAITSSPLVLNIPANTPVGSFIGTLTVKNASGCISQAKTFTLTVNGGASLPSSTPTLCQGSALTTITHSTVGVTGIGAATGLPTGVTATWSSPTITINGTPTAAGTFNYSIPLTAGSCSSAATGTIIVKTMPATLTQGTLTRPTCVVSTGSVQLNSLPTSGAWTLKQDGVPILSTSGGTGTYTVSGLAPATYNFTVTNGSCTSAALPVTILPIISTTWTGTWSNGVPNNTMKVILSGTNSISGAIDGCSCEVNPGSTITVLSGAVLKLENELKVDASSTLTFENGASLVQVINDNTVNTGNIIYKRNTSLVADFDYVYWGTPVKSQQLNVLSPSSDKYYSYWNGAWVPESGSNIMNPRKGYIIRVPRLYTTYSQAVQFVGVPNNGEFDVDVLTVKSNLLGNPYPSAIDADLFMSDSRNGPKINGGLYFWTHNTKRQQSGSQFIYVASDYAVYNITGLASGAASTAGVVNNGDIAAGQSFMVPCLTAGKLYFTNSMRISDSGSRNSNFFKPSDTKKAAAIEKNRVWLNMTNDGGAFKQLLVGYITGATNGVDNLYDAETMNGNVFIDFYSVNDSKKYTIQGRRVPFETADEVALGYQSTIAGTFQIGIDKVDGSLVNQAVYLEDKMTNTIHDLKSGAYSFTTAIGSFNDRFVLRYTNTSKLGVDDVAAKAKGVIVSVKNSQIKINSFDKSITSVMVYDLKGSLLYEKNKVGKNEFTVDHLTSASQFMIVMTQLEDGKWVSEEIIFHD